MPTPLQQTPSIVWGVLSFVAPGATESNFDIEAMGETHFGNPEPIFETVRSLLIDGSLVTRTHDDNRTVPIRLRISANDGESSAEAEAALVAQERQVQPPPIEYTSPLGLSATSVFDTVVARLDRDTSEGWDVDEKERGYRYYLLTLTCLPFARAVESTIVPALPAPPASPTTVDIDTCDATTGWTVESSDSTPTGPTVVSGAVQATADVADGGYLRLVRTGAVTMGATPYLAVEVSLDSNPVLGGSWQIMIDGETRDPVAVIASGSIQWRAYFDLTGESFSVLKVFYAFGAGVSDTWTLSVHNVARTDAIDYGTTARQQLRLATVAGSTPTQAAVRLSDATPAALGTDILVHTSRVTGWQPDLRRLIVTSSAPAPVAGTVSGSVNDLSTPTVIRIPASTLNAGTYALLARMYADTAGALTWQARMTDAAGADTVGSGLVVEGEVDIPDMGAPGAGGADMVVLSLGAMQLPVIEVESDEYAVELTLTGTVSMALDDAWLLPLDDGALTWVRDPDGILTNIEVRSPELGATRPSVWGGTGAPGVAMACIDHMCESFGSHRFEPGIVPTFTVATISLVSQCEIEFFPRFHGNVWGGGTS